MKNVTRHKIEQESLPQKSQQVNKGLIKVICYVVRDSMLRQIQYDFMGKIKSR